MTSLLTFLWKRQDIDASYKDENAAPLPHVASNASEEADPQDVDATFHHTSRQIPNTPDGLKGRQTVDEMRKELGLVEDAVGGRYSETRSEQPTSTSDYLNGSHLLALPKRPVDGTRNEFSLLVRTLDERYPVLKEAPSRSNRDLPPALPPALPRHSPPSRTSSALQHTLSPHYEPMASPSSFCSGASYTTDTASFVAQSPTLLVGQTRTTVGAIVAMSHATLAAAEQSAKSSARLGVLPPTKGWGDSRQDYSIDSSSFSIPYQELNDSLQSGKVTRESKRKEKIRFLASTDGSCGEFTTDSASSNESNWRHAHEEQQDSLNSRAVLIERDTSHNDNFDLGYIVENDEELNVSGREVMVHPSDHCANVSAISASSKENDTLIYDDTNMLSYVGGESSQAAALMRRKAKNQRRAKESLLAGLIERLQDNVELISDMDYRPEKDTVPEWFLKTPLDSEGLLTGFSKDTRLSILKGMDLILNEMNVAQPEEFFLSPTQMPEIAESHDDLEHALAFCKTLVEMAIPETEKEEWGSFSKMTGGPQLSSYRWKCLPGLQKAMRSNEIPDSPETVRGGETALFSLPSESDATPHTSNVSTATTITTQNSPIRPRQLQQQQQQVGTELSQTMAFSCSMIQRMSLACHFLGNLGEGCTADKSTIKAAEDIKLSYKQLLLIRAADIKLVIDSFELELPELQLSRIVSKDDEEPQLALPPAVLRATANPPTVLRATANILETATIEAPKTNGVTVFSPTTADMITEQAEVIEYDEECDFDDLRRQVGSNDYDDNDVREGPECERIEL